MSSEKPLSFVGEDKKMGSSGRGGSDGGSLGGRPRRGGEEPVCVRCYSVSDPTRHEDGFTIYRVTQQTIPIGELEKNIQEVVVWKRFNDFKKLYKEMSSLHSRLHRREQFPEFSRPQLFNRFDPSVIEERMRSGQDLLNFIGQRKYLVNSKEFRQFFEHAQPVSPVSLKWDSLLIPPLSPSCPPGTRTARGNPEGTFIVPVDRDGQSSETDSARSSVSSPSAAGLRVVGSESRVGVARCGQLSPERRRAVTPDSIDEERCRGEGGEEVEGESWLHHPIQDEGSSGDGLDDDDEGISPDDPLTASYNTTRPDSAPTHQSQHLELVLCDQSEMAILDQPDLALFDPLRDDQLDVDPSLTNEHLLSMIPAVSQSHDNFTVNALELNAFPGELSPFRNRMASSVGSADATNLPDILEGPSGSLLVDADSNMASCSRTAFILDSATASSPHETSAAANVAFRARTGSIVERGRGDLTESPFDAATSRPEGHGRLGTRVGSFDSTARNVGAFRNDVDIQPIQKVVMKQGGVEFHCSSEGSKRGMEGRGDEKRALETQASLVGWEGGVDQTGYIMDAAKLIWQALEAEQEGEYRAAFAQYKCAIAMLLKGVQADEDPVRRDAVRKKTARYLVKAEQLYHAHMVVDSEPPRHGMWQRGSSMELDASIVLLRGSVAELGQYKVLGVLHRVLLVLDTTSDATYVIKVLHKTCGGTSPRPTPRSTIVPTHIPYIVSFVRFFETDSALFLVLQHACGGTLFSYLGARLHGGGPGGGVGGEAECGAVEGAAGEMEEDSVEGVLQQGPGVGEESNRMSAVSVTRGCGGAVGPSGAVGSAERSGGNVAEGSVLDLIDSTGSLVELNVSRGLACQRDSQMDAQINSRMSAQIDSQMGTNAGIDSEIDARMGLSDPTVAAETVNSGAQKTSIYDIHTDRSSSDVNPTSARGIHNSSSANDIQHNQLSAGDVTRCHSSNVSSCLSSAASTPANAQAKLHRGLTPAHRPSSADRCTTTQDAPRRQRNLSTAFDELDLARGAGSAHEGGPSPAGVGWAVRGAWLPESCVRQWAAEIVVAVGGLHLMGFMCRDLRPANLLLGEGGHILLTYFSQWSSVDRVVSQEAIVNYYCAPEIWSVHDVTPACDWWSLGAILFELFTGQNLKSCHPAGITQHTLIEIPTYLSQEAQSLLAELLRYNPSERLGAGPSGTDDLRSHPFFGCIDWNNLIG